MAASQAGVTMNNCIIFYNQNQSGELRVYTLGEHKTTKLTKEESDVYLSWAGRTEMSYVYLQNLKETTEIYRRLTESQPLAEEDEMRGLRS